MQIGLIEASFALAELGAVDDRAARELLKERGVVLLRGFPVDRDSFIAFSGRFARQFIVHQAVNVGLRTLAGEDGTTASVTTGRFSAGWHRERGYYPCSPDVLFFYCEEAPRPDEGTYLCDGVELLAALSPPVREFVTSHRIVWRVATPRALWHPIFGTDDPAEMGRRLEPTRPEETIAHRFAGESLEIEHTLPCVTRTRWQGDAYCNSVSTHRNMRRRAGVAPDGFGLLLENGQPFPDDVLDEIEETARAVMRDHAWVRGDLLIVDNSRVMHARPSLSTDERRILIRMCHVDF